MHSKSAIFLGTKPAAAIALQILVGRGWDIKGVVTPLEDLHPWVSGPKVAEVAELNNIPVYQDQVSLNAHSLKADLVISYMYRSLVKPETINSAKVAALNFHPAPLPYFGGWAFYNVAIIEDVVSYGPTCHYMDEDFDTGPILKVDRFEVDASRETAVSLERKTQISMLNLFKEVVGMVEQNIQLPIEYQKDSEMRYFNKKEFESLKRIPRTATADVIDKFARAFWYPPYKGAYLELDCGKVEIVPEIVKEDIARHYHYDDYEILKQSTT